MSRADRSKSFASISQALERSGNPVLVEAGNRYRAMFPLNAAWQRAIDPPLRQRARPTVLRDGVLTVHAESPVWANMLRNSEQSIVASLRGSGLDSIQSLRIRISPPDSGPEKTPPAKEREGDTPELRRLFAQLRKALD